ncbi:MULTISPECIES: hypothetical protein [unclassified Paraflavitalea]|uniref:hypothetical protein n=1 Tax=unclassified Paraflavitalea TaxID=2798305 RepID=UPI003D352035
MIEVTFQGVSFNATHFSNFKQKEFIDECKTSQIFSEYGEKEQKELLVKAHELILEATKKATE